MDRDRNLLFGISAVQFDQIVPMAFVRAARKWAGDSRKDLSDYLVEDGFITEHERDFILWTVDRAIESANGNVEVAIEQIGGDEALRTASQDLIQRTDSGGIRIAAQDPQPEELVHAQPHDETAQDSTSHVRHRQPTREEVSSPSATIGPVILVGILLLFAGAGFVAWRFNVQSNRNVSQTPSAEPQIEESMAAFEFELAREAEARRAIQAERDRRRSLAETLQAHRRSLLLVEGQLINDPENFSLQFSLAEIYASISDVQTRRGDYRAALDADEEWIETLVKLESIRPNDASVHAAFIRSHRSRGQNLMGREDYKNARNALQSSLEFCVDAETASMENALSECWETYIEVANLGEIENDQEGVVDALRSAVETARELVDTDPTESRYRIMLGTSYASFASAYARAGYIEPAIDALQQAYRTFEKEIRARPTDDRLLDRMSDTYQELIELYAQKGDQVMVSGLRETYMNLRDTLAQAQPLNSAVQRDLMHLYTAMGITYMKEDNEQGAITSFEASAEIAQRLIDRDPDDLSLRHALERLERRLERQEIKAEEQP